MNTSEIRPFGEELKAFRERKRMSQLELAQAIGVNRKTIGPWELGKNPPRDRTRVLELARVLGLDDQETNRLLTSAFLDPLPPWYVPYHRNPWFTGREEVLQALRNTLVPGTTAAVMQSRAISGLGGIGKTQTALEYVYRYRDDYSAVLWLQADSREIFDVSCSQLAYHLGLPVQTEADQATIDVAIQQWLRRKSNWLLVLDSVEDFLMVEEFLPPGYRGCVLITTRAQTTGFIAFAQQLDLMSEEDGVLFLLRRAGLLEQANPADRAQAKDLWELVEGLPLALDQIGAYVRASTKSLSEYRNLYEDQQRHLDLLKRRGKFPPGHPESVVTTFTIAFEKVQKANPAAADLLRVFALLHSKAIPEEIITRGGDQLGSRLSSLIKDPLLFDQAIDILQTYSLVRRDAQESTLSVHSLVQAVLQGAMPEAMQAIWRERVITALNVVFPERVEESNWNHCRRLILHARACVAHMQSCKHLPPALPALLTRIAHYLDDLHQYTEAEVYYQQAILIFEQLLGPEHLQLVESITQLALLYQRTSQHFEEAESLLQRALSICEKLLGPENVRLASLCRLRGQLYSENLFGPKRILGIRPIDFPELLDQHSHQKQDRFQQAEHYFQRALRIYKKVLRPVHQAIAETLLDLAELYANTIHYAEDDEAAISSYRKATNYFGEALEMAKTYAPLHEDAVQFLKRWAVLHLQLERDDVTIQCYHTILDIEEKEYGPSHPQVALSIDELAQIYMRQDKFAEAEALFLQIFPIMEQVYGSSSSQLAPLFEALAVCCNKQKRYEEAIAYFQRALDIREKEFGPEDSHLVVPLCLFAAIYEEQSKPEVALPLYQRAVSISEQNFGIAHRQTFDCHQSLIFYYVHYSMHKELCAFLQKLIPTYEQAYGPNSREVAGLQLLLERCMKKSRGEDRSTTTRTDEDSEAATVEFNIGGYRIMLFSPTTEYQGAYRQNSPEGANEPLPSDILHVVFAFAASPTLSAARLFLEAHPELLDTKGDGGIVETRWKELAKQPELDLHDTVLKERLRLLVCCRDEGIESAFARQHENMSPETAFLDDLNHLCDEVIATLQVGNREEQAALATRLEQGRMEDLPIDGARDFLLLLAAELRGQKGTHLLAEKLNPGFFLAYTRLMATVEQTK